MSQLVLYTTDDGRSQIQLRADSGTVWLTQLEMAELFQTSKQNIAKHLKAILTEQELVQDSVVNQRLTTAADGKNYRVAHYNLDAILAVGYRVRSPRGVEFRRWASTVLKEYLAKGFVIDDERLKNPDGRPDYFDEMLARIRDIRASEKRFYQKVRDLFALAADYDKSDETTQTFFATAQNLLLYAVTQKTAAELIVSRANAADLLKTLQAGFKYIETESFESTFGGLFSEIDLGSSKLGKGYPERNAKLCNIIKKIADGLAEFSDKLDTLGDAYEYLIGQFAAGSGKKAGEFYTPQQISDILLAIVTLDSQEPKTGVKQRLDSVMDFACGSGSLLLNVRKKTKEAGGTIGRIYGQEKNITTYNLARMNMLLHGVKDTEFEIFHGDTLTNDWDILRELNPAKKPAFDAIVANPPFSYRWEPTEAMGDDVRFKNHGLAPKSAADFAFLLHGFHFLKDEGVMAIILPHGVLFRGGAEERIRTKLLKDGHIDTVIGLPSNLFYSTGIPVCILVLKKCKKPDDVLFINAAEHFVKGKRQNQLTDEHIKKIIKTYQYREEDARYSRRVGMAEIEKNDFNLNISRYISTAVGEAEIDLQATHGELVEIEKAVTAAKHKHNAFLKELGLRPLP
jgi:type I restriction enzyme M protein